MRAPIWIDVLKKFNRYCYGMSNGGTDPVVLLCDNCSAHKMPDDATPWRDGDLLGYRTSW